MAATVRIAPTEKSPLVVILLIALFAGQVVRATDSTVPIWGLFESRLDSSRDYENPLYDVRLQVTLTSPTRRLHRIEGFWNGGSDWRFRFQPDELGTWSYRTECSIDTDSGLHSKEGRFTVVENDSSLSIFRRGKVIRPAGRYYLTYADGTPFFWTADTAWNGALKSTEEEWIRYLKNRIAKGFNTIQFVTTQWRGGEADRLGRVAFTGQGRIRIEPEFFQRLDGKVNQINELGLVAAPVLLWALPRGAGRHLSPGYTLPEEEAILLARYMVARYGGHHVVWFLGGDGAYIEEFEQRWKNIGEGVFGESHPGLVAQHPHGRSWIGDVYADAEWLDIVGYQSSHSQQKPTVDWINQGPMAARWDKLPPRPIINLEPIYEQIREDGTAADVRRACYWSVFATPPAGISYGANGVWPWLREGEKILNHRDAPWTSPWDASLDLPAAFQIGYLSNFVKRFQWWLLRPLHDELLLEQPGEERFDHWVSILGTEQRDLLLIYLPHKLSVELRNPRLREYQVRYFDPIQNQFTGGPRLGSDPILRIDPGLEQDQVVILQQRLID